MKRPSSTKERQQVPTDKLFRSWRDVQLRLSAGDEAVKQLPPASLQMVALAQLVERGKPVKADSGRPSKRRYRVRSGFEPK